MNNDIWVPRHCTPEYFQARQRELAGLRQEPFPRPCTEQDLDANQQRIYPWMEQQGRGPEPYRQWDERERMSFTLHPLSWWDELWQVAVVIVTLALLGAALYGVGLHYGWY